MNSLSWKLLYLLLLAFATGGCVGGGKEISSISSKINGDRTHQRDSSSAYKEKQYTCDFSWRPMGTKFLITFPGGGIINTDDFDPIISLIPKETIAFEYDHEEKRYFYRVANIDFTKIDRRTKQAITKNLHFEIPLDIDSILYADYRIDFPSDTTVVMTNKPTIRESLILYGRCWKNCHDGEYGMEIIIGSIGYTAWFDKQGNKKTEFFGDIFGNGAITNDYKYTGGVVGGYYSDGGGFYRKSRIYIYDINEKKLIFHKLINFGEECSFSFWDKADKFVYSANMKLVFIDISSRIGYSIEKYKIDISKVNSVDKYGYHFKDGTSILFEQDFVKIPFEKLMTPYPF